MAGTNTLFTAIDKNKDGLMEEYELENAWESVDTDPSMYKPCGIVIASHFRKNLQILGILTTFWVWIRH